MIYTLLSGLILLYILAFQQVVFVIVTANGLRHISTFFFTIFFSM